MEVYVWLSVAILCLLGAAQNMVFGHTISAIGLIIVGVTFLYVFKREKNKVKS